MSLHVRQLNADASFSLSFEQTSESVSSSQRRPAPFTILTDPWIVGPSSVFHPVLAVTTHRQAACVSTLADLPEPDLVVISQHKSDHCNEATLRQLLPTGTKTLILAVPAAAKLIKSWNYFDESSIIAIPKWDESAHLAGRKEPLVRVQVPPPFPGGEPGEVTVAYIAQDWDVNGLHTAIGITYTPPPSPQGAAPRCLATPSSALSQDCTIRSPTRHIVSPTVQEQLHASPTPPASPFRSVQSSLSVSSVRSVQSSQSAQPLRPSLPPAAQDRDNPTLSVIFSPHGISYRSLQPYVTNHLLPSSALPLTALLHCLDSVSNPWWLGGNISFGAPAGQETALKLGARLWVSAHDGDKDIDGLMTKMLSSTKYAREDVQRGLTPRGKAANGTGETEVVILETGEEICVTVDGIVDSRKV